MSRLPLASAALVLLAVPGGADEVKVRTLEDGSRLIYNESSSQRARRTSNRLVDVPRADLREIIDRYARARRLDPRLVQAVVQVESGYNPQALSSKGAMGLMQLMPGTASDLRVADVWDPDQNVDGGTRYLRWLLDRFSGDTVLALAAYNAGPTAVERHGGVPPYAETEHYVRKVLTLFRGGPPSDIHLAQAQVDARRAAAARRPRAPAGKSVYVTRDANGRIVVTTSPPR